MKKYKGKNWRLYRGDCLKVIKRFDRGFQVDAVQLKRKVIGIEKEKTYVNDIINRMKTPLA